jgi:hypothetical protein
MQVEALAGGCWHRETSAAMMPPAKAAERPSAGAAPGPAGGGGGEREGGGDWGFGGPRGSGPGQRGPSCSVTEGPIHTHTRRREGWTGMQAVRQFGRLAAVSGRGRELAGKSLGLRPDQGTGRCGFHFDPGATSSSLSKPAHLIRRPSSSLSLPVHAGLVDRPPHAASLGSFARVPRGWLVRHTMGADSLTTTHVNYLVWRYVSQNHGRLPPRPPPSGGSRASRR